MRGSAFRLTPREQQILVLIVEPEATVRSVAVQLGVKRQHVKNYLSVIYQKCGVSGLHELRALQRQADCT